MWEINEVKFTSWLGEGWDAKIFVLLKNEDNALTAKCSQGWKNFKNPGFLSF